MKLEDKTFVVEEYILVGIVVSVEDYK